MNNDKLEFDPTEDDLRHLREWISKTPHIVQDYDDNFLSTFVRGCKGSLTKTKIILENLNSLGMKYPDMFENLDPLEPKMQEWLDTKLGYYFPKKAPDGSTIFLLSLNFKVEKQTTTCSLEMYRFMLMSLYVAIWENVSPDLKITAISDLKDVKLHHVTSTLTLPVMRKIIFFIHGSVPSRVQNNIYVNMPSFAEPIVQIAKVILPEKIFERSSFCTTEEVLSQLFPADVLPKEYGGTGESTYVLHDRWRKKVESYRDRLIEEQKKMRSLDHIRPMCEEEKIVESFRKLDVD